LARLQVRPNVPISGGSFQVVCLGQGSINSQEIIRKSEKKLGKTCGNMWKYGENAVPNQWGYCKTDKKLDQQDITRLSIRSNQMSAWASKTPKVPKQIASRTTCFLAGLLPLP
jgi:hypothetical protein